MPSASRANSPKPSDGLLPVRALARLSSTSISPGGTPSARAATAMSFSRTARLALCAALPPATAWRLANAPTPMEIAAVSESVTTTSSIRQPSRSATTWASVVRVPWPWLVAPVATATLPFGMMRTVAPS